MIVNLARREVLTIDLYLKDRFGSGTGMKTVTLPTSLGLAHFMYRVQCKIAEPSHSGVRV